MNQDITFSYNYSAKENEEVKNIRQKYLPREESKLDELKRLDKLVENSGIAESLCAGIGGALIFGTGMCLAMQVIAKSPVWVILGILVGITGVFGMISAYPIYRKIFNKTKMKYAPRILEITSELAGESNKIN